MTALGPLSMLFVGPLGFLLVTLLGIIIVLALARFVLRVAWKVVLVGAVLLGVLWLIGVLTAGRPNGAPIGTLSTHYPGLEYSLLILNTAIGS